MTEKGGVSRMQVLTRRIRLANHLPWRLSACALRTVLEVGAG